jgi:hypothetical protein
MTLRCIAFHTKTGQRCSRRVSIQRELQILKLCREHGRSILLTMHSSSMSDSERESLSRRNWNHISEVRS